MGFRFRKGLRIAPDHRLDVSKQDVEARVGGKGEHISLDASVTKLTSSTPKTGTSNRKNLSFLKTKKTEQKNDVLTPEQKKKKQLAAIEQNQLEVILFNSKIDMLRILHTEHCEHINWQEVLNEQHPFQNNDVGPNEIEAIKALESYKPTWGEKLLGRIEERKTQLLDMVEKAKQDDLEIVELWEEKKEFAEKILSGEISAYNKALHDDLLFDDLFELGVEIHYYVLSASTLAFEVDIKSKETVPTQSLSLTKCGNLSSKNMTMAMYYAIYQDYVCSIAMRLGKDGFNLLPVDNIYVHINDIPLDSLDLRTVLSVKFERAYFDTINFDDCDCSDEVEKFEHHMHFNRKKGLLPVDKILEEI